MEYYFRVIIVCLIGYFSGSILYGRLIPKAMYGIDIIKVSHDKNPGTSNVFRYCGKKCGVITSILEFAKGFFPVVLGNIWVGMENVGILFFLIITAPVLGHMFSVFNHFSGGIGIAPLFGTLIAVYPFTYLLIGLVGIYAIGKFVIKYKDKNNRTLFVFSCFGVLAFLTEKIIVVKTSYIFLAALILGRKIKAMLREKQMVLEG